MISRSTQALTAYRRAATAAEQVEILRHLSVRWDLLVDAAQGPEVWKVIARQMGPQALRMNLNTLLLTPSGAPGSFRISTSPHT